MSYPLGPPEPPFNFETLVSYFHTVLDALPDQRTGNNLVYSMKDAALGAFAVFFTQSPSFLAFQKAMQGQGHQQRPNALRDGGDSLR